MEDTGKMERQTARESDFVVLRKSQSDSSNVLPLTHLAVFVL